MEPTREPRSPAAELAAPRDTPPDDAVVAYLRARAPGLPTPRSDARTVTSRARGALRRRRVRNSVMALVGAATAYLTLALAGPLPVPGVGTVSLPGSAALQALAEGLFPGGPPGPDQQQSDVDRLETQVLPVVEELNLSVNQQCHIPADPRGNYRDEEPWCGQVTDAIERSGVAVERIFRDVDGLGTHFQLRDDTWQYNWEYAYLPGVSSPPLMTGHPIEEQWTHIRGDWWLHRVFDD
jgi:hypothetical protein